MRIKVFRGTSNHGEDLCRSCRKAHRIVFRNGDEVVECSAMSYPIREKVVDCNKYDNAATPSIYDMQLSAWIVEPATEKKPMGFLSPQEYKKKHGQFDVPDVPGEY